MILSPIQALGDGYDFYLNKTRFPLKSVAGMTKNGVLQEAQLFRILGVGHLVLFRISLFSVLMAFA